MIAIEVLGVPAPKGSARAFLNRRTNKTIPSYSERNATSGSTRLARAAGR